MWNLLGWYRQRRAARLEREENYLDGLRMANADFPGSHAEDVAAQERLVTKLRRSTPSLTKSTEPLPTRSAPAAR